MRVYSRITLVGPFIIMLAAGGCVMPDNREEKRDKLDTWMTYVCDGLGTSKPLFSAKDYFTLYLEALDDRELRIRYMAHAMLLPNRIFCAKYPQVLDAFIASGKDKELGVALRRSWKTAERGTWWRLTTAEVLACLIMRQYLWKHPEVASEAGAIAPGVAKEKAPFCGWGRFGPREMDYLSAKVIAEGDEEFKLVWDDYSLHADMLRAGTLKHAPLGRPAPSWEESVSQE